MAFSLIEPQNLTRAGLTLRCAAYPLHVDVTPGISTQLIPQQLLA